jgi:hypothetical protein
MFLSHVRLLLPDEKVSNAPLRLNALVKVMLEHRLVAVARYVFRDGLSPTIVALLPHVRSSYNGLLMVDLPFSHDFRSLPLMSLEVETSPSKSNKGVERELLLPEQFQPSFQQRQAAHLFVSQFRLVDSDSETDSDSDSDDEIACNSATSSNVSVLPSRKGKELVPPKQTFHPIVQRLLRAIEARAVDSSCFLPYLVASGKAPNHPNQSAKDPAFSQFSPPSHVWKHPRMQSLIQQIEIAFPVQKLDVTDTTKRKWDENHGRATVLGEIPLPRGVLQDGPRLYHDSALGESHSLSSNSSL